MTTPTNHRRKWGSSTPPREDTLQPHFRDNGRMGDKKRPHILPPLTPASPAALPIPQADRGGQRPPPRLLTVMKNGERDRATASGHSEPLASKLKLLPWAIAATAAIDHARAVSEGALAVRKTATGPTETTGANTGKTLAVRKPPTLTQRPHLGKQPTRRSTLTASRTLNREQQAKRQSEQQDRSTKSGLKEPPCLSSRRLGGQGGKLTGAALENLTRLTTSFEHAEMRRERQPRT